MNSQPPYGSGPFSNEEKHVLEKSKSLLNWLTQRNFNKIKDEIVQTIRASPSAFVIKSLVCCIFDMAMVDNAYVLFSRLCVELFLELPPIRSPEITTFERLFLSKCRLELQNSSPNTERPPLVYVDVSDCWRFVKIVRVLAQLFNNKMVSESTRQSIIQVLMNPMFPPERNIDAMNCFLSSFGKLSDFQFSDENFKKLLQNSKTLELEKSYTEEAKLRKESEDELAMKKDELQSMKRLLASYKEEQVTLQLKAQELEKQHHKELQIRKKTEYALITEIERTEELKLRVETLENELDDMRLKAEELQGKYEAELILRKESETALNKERNELEAMTTRFESCKLELENLASRVITLQESYEKESSLRKETEDALLSELQIVKGLLESYNKEADAMRVERDNALKTVQELTRKQLEERQPPQSFFCPITQEVMKDPHFAADGFTYEAEAIKKWLSTGHDTSPMTNLKLSHRNLVPNRALRSVIQELV